MRGNVPARGAAAARGGPHRAATGQTRPVLPPSPHRDRRAPRRYRRAARIDVLRSHVMPLSDEDDEYLDDFDSSGELTPMSSVPLRGGRRLATVASGGDAADDGHATEDRMRLTPMTFSVDLVLDERSARRCDRHCDPLRSCREAPVDVVGCPPQNPNDRWIQTPN